MANNRIKDLILGILVLSAVLCSQASAGTQEAVILFMQGDVKVKSLENNEWKDADVDMRLYIGDSLKTGTDSWAEVGFGKDFTDVVRVKENTRSELIDLGPVSISLLKGELRALVESLPEGTTFQIRTPTAVCGARGTGWDTNTDGKKVVVDAYEEEVYFYPIPAEDEEVVDPIIKAGKRGVLDDPKEAVTIKDVPIAKMKGWTKWKNDYQKRRSNKDKNIKGKLDKLKKARKISEHLKKGKKGIRRDKIDERRKRPPKPPCGPSRDPC
ncbi:FecR family protein [Omnitrophica bacterium]|nr:FecR family protein [Candidatus Omnitrophota bacterium]